MPLSGRWCGPLESARFFAARRRMPQRTLVTFAVLGVLGCGLTAPECPDGGTLFTSENFGATFMSRYCIQCHGPTLAEKKVTLDTAASVKAFAGKANLAAGVGTSMPPSGITAPSTEERSHLSQWLACGAP